jgi:hypothetical protein
MAADLHIHVFTDKFTEEHYKKFQSNTICSKYFNPKPVGQTDSNLYELCADTPQVWVGEVSWLKAALTEDQETFVPNMVAKISEIIGEDFPVIDDELTGKILDACKIENTTQYDVTNKNSLEKFLKEHKGQKAFCISW